MYQNGADNSHLTMLDLRPEQGRALRTVDLKGPLVFLASAGVLAFVALIVHERRAEAPVLNLSLSRMNRLQGLDEVAQLIRQLQTPGDRAQQLSVRRRAFRQRLLDLRFRGGQRGADAERVAGGRTGRRGPALVQQRYRIPGSGRRR